MVSHAYVLALNPVMRSDVSFQITVLLAASLVGMAPSAGASQQISTVSDEATCPACKIRLIRVQTLDPRSSFGGLKSGSHIVRNSKGFYFAAPTHDPGKIAFFDPRGRYLGSFGERGSGPGELPEVRRIFVGPGDSLYVAGRGAAVNVFDHANRFVRSFPVPAKTNDLLFTGRQLLVSAEPTVMRSAPVQAITPDGDPVRFVTKEEWSLVSPLPFELFKGAPGTFWTAQSDGREYRLSLNQIGGRQIRAFRRNLAMMDADGIWRWVPERFTRGRTPENPVSPRLKDFAVDGAGRIWVLLLRENEEWVAEAQKKLQAQAGSEGNVRRLSVEDTRQRFERFLEVLDPASGSVLVRARVPQLVGEFLDNQHVYTFRESNAGGVVIDVWRLQLENLTTGGANEHPGAVSCHSNSHQRCRIRLLTG
jgi:hypothetical protein